VCKTNSKPAWKIGRVLQFVNWFEKTKATQQYHGFCANVDDKQIGVLCSWYTSCQHSTRKFSIESVGTIHGYLSFSMYLCTLSSGCFEHTKDTLTLNGIRKSDDTNAQLVTSECLILSEDTVSIIHNLFQDYIVSDMVSTAQCSESSLPVSKKKSP